MDTQTLVEPDVALGGLVADALASDPTLKAGSAMWWFDESGRRWLFAVSTPVYESRGAQAAYLQVRKVLEEKDLLSKLPLDRVLVVPDNHPVLGLIRTIFEGGNFRLSGNVVNGTLLPELFIYRIEKRRARSRKKG